MAFYRLLLVASLIAASGAIPLNDEIIPEDNQHFNAGTLDKFNNKDTPAEQFIDKDTPAEQFIEEAAGQREIAGDMSLDQATTFWWLTQHVYTDTAGSHRSIVAHKVDEKGWFGLGKIWGALGWEDLTHDERVSLESMGFEQVGDNCEEETWDAGWIKDYGSSSSGKWVTNLHWFRQILTGQLSAVEDAVETNLFGLERKAWAKAAVYKKVQNNKTYSGDGIPIDSLVVAFAGTDFFNIPDWTTNLVAVLTAATEEGFSLGYQQEVKRVQECIANRLDSVSTGATADYIVGHSQGGADAVVYYEVQKIGLYQAENRTLHAGETLDPTAVPNWKNIKSRISATSQVVTFGAPKTHYDEAKDEYRCDDTVPGHRWFHAEDRVASDVSIDFREKCHWGWLYWFWDSCDTFPLGLGNYKHNVRNTHRFSRSTLLKSRDAPKWAPLGYDVGQLGWMVQGAVRMFIGHWGLWVRADQLDNDVRIDSTDAHCMDVADAAPCSGWWHNSNLNTNVGLAAIFSGTVVPNNGACILSSFAASLPAYHASYDVQLGLSEGYSEGGGFTITDDGVQTNYNEGSD